MSTNRPSKLTTQRTDVTTALAIEEMKENISALREIVNDRIINNNLLADEHTLPGQKFNTLIEDKYYLQGTWLLLARGIDVPSSFQPKTEEEVNPGFDLQKYYTYNVSPLVIKQDVADEAGIHGDTGDSRFMLCLSLPDIMGLAPINMPDTPGIPREGMGYQPAYLDNTDPSGGCLTIRDYEDNGAYQFREFKRDSNGIINMMHGMYVESGYNTLNTYQAPRIMAVECWKLGNSTNYQDFPLPLTFPAEEEKPTTLEYNDPNYSEPNPISGVNDIQFWKQDYFYEFTPISSKQWVKQVTYPVQNRDGRTKGIGYSLFRYTTDKGETVCLQEDRYAFYDKTYEYDKTKNYKKYKYTIPEDATIVGYYMTSANSFTPTYKDQHNLGVTNVVVYRFADNDVTLEDIQSKQFISVNSPTIFPSNTGYSRNGYRMVLDRENKTFKVEKVEVDENIAMNTARNYSYSTTGQSTITSSSNGSTSGSWEELRDWFKDATN